MHVTAVVTWFRPAVDALDALADALAACDAVVVVDNTPAGEPLLPAPDGVDLVRPGRNLGLASALQLGAGRAPAHSDALLLLDQDSRLPDGLVPGLSALLVGDVGAAAPAPWDADEGRYLDPRTALRPEVADLPVVITSGMLVRREALAAAGPFREDFFVDSVDQDLCLRLRRAGWRVVQDRRLLLAHRLGETRWHSVLGGSVRASHHPSWRLYSAARNSTVLTRENLRREPRWAVVNALLLLYWVLTVAAFEPPRAARLSLFAQGVLDGLAGRPPRHRPPGA